MGTAVVLGWKARAFELSRSCWHWGYAAREVAEALESTGKVSASCPHVLSCNRVYFPFLLTSLR